MSVPKFGDWASEGGSQEIPYTICFDNARKGRSSSGKIINPNDPQQNPNLFPYGATQRDEPRNLAPQGIRTTTTSQPDRKTRANDRPNSRSVTPSTRTENGSKLSRPQNNHGYTPTPTYKNNAAAAAADHAKTSRVAVSPAPPFDSVRGNRGGGNGIVLPKFGEWDAKNSAAGEGYTQVFNKVREEKKNSSGMTPLPVHAEKSPDPRGHKNSTRSGRNESTVRYI